MFGFMCFPFIIGIIYMIMKVDSAISPIFTKIVNSSKAFYSEVLFIHKVFNFYSPTNFLVNFGYDDYYDCDY